MDNQILGKISTTYREFWAIFVIFGRSFDNKNENRLTTEVM